MLPGECHFTNAIKCECCGGKMELCVTRSNAGYYIGHVCDECGPYDRCTGYFATKELAENELGTIKEFGFGASLYSRGGMFG
jgi:hypothetical protein